jgi:fluoride exporter
MEKYLIIGAGAVLGAYCRHWTGLWTAQKWGESFALGTLLINVVGSFALGVFLSLHLDRGFFTENARYLVAVGWCASFTTYSTFSWDTFRYLQEGNIKLAAANLFLTLIGCFLATWAGVAVAKAI